MPCWPWPSCVERRIASPLLELGLFRNARFVGVQALAASPAFLFIALIAMPGRFIGMDYGALAAGQLMIGRRRCWSCPSWPRC